MRKQKGLTRIDVVIALACIALVLTQAGIINAGGRQRAKREVCLSNLRTLTSAWQTYASDNAGNIVNAAPMITNTPCPGSCSGSLCAAAPPPSNSWDYPVHKNELPWIGSVWGPPGSYLVLGNECCQKCAINTGALWKYTNDYNIYHCPFGKKDAIVTYAIVCSMNGMYQFVNAPSSLMIKNLSQITNASKKIVFIDLGRPAIDTYAVFYNQQQWLDIPPVQHESATCVSFADGHSVFHQWKSQETIAMGIKGIYGMAPLTCDAKNDLYWLQIGCWGQLGYTPTCPVNPE